MVFMSQENMNMWVLEDTDTGTCVCKRGYASKQILVVPQQRQPDIKR